MPSKITQIDVAKAAKVSTGTVSRVINNHPFVSESARAAVLEAIKKLGYTPNTIAQSLAYGRSKNILILFLDKQPILPSTWQYELPILQGINDSLKDHAYSLQIEMLTLGLENSQPAFDMMMSKSSFDGLIVLTSWNVEDQFLCRITERGIPMTFIGNGPYQIDGNPVGSTVLFDNSNIVKEVYTFLRSLGHRRIAFIKGTSDQLHAQIRLQAFTE
ncbi:MAG: LacI family transcriptional regulator, partial [Spirochaetaceae bacterium]|nr:LacI family transcriptional regulator [Spirochaetaceae bacterium]